MDEPEFISKSQRKRDSEALQDLGESLLDLSVDQLKKFDLPENLLEAVLACKKIPPSKGTAFKRQRQYIGKLMRSIDPAPITEQLNALKGLSVKENALMHQAERWRERLLIEPGSLAEFVQAHPGAVEADLAALINGTKAERAKGQPPKHFRELYKKVHAQLKAASQASATPGATATPDDHEDAEP